MPLTIDDIQRLSRLAKIELSPDESLRTQDQLNGIFLLVEQLQGVDTKNIEPLCHPIAVIEEMTLRLRPDIVTETDNRTANMANAPAGENGLFLVPKVLE